MISISPIWSPSASHVVYHGKAEDLLKTIPDNTIQLIITSPPYNMGKAYESEKSIPDYIREQSSIISECYRTLSSTGSIVWQVGNYVVKGSIIPLDIILYPVFASLGLKLRNRIIWHFEHGLHCSHRFSGRYETCMWFTKSDDYVFNLDPVRVPQKYPSKKYYKGPKVGQLSCNPLGKNPGDIWDITNIKHNHPEKTGHPCQFPLDLVSRFIKSLTSEGDWVVDPFLGSGTTSMSAIKLNRRSCGSEVYEPYLSIIHDRLTNNSPT
jgi:adenine-specific DNA-methyltransferase